MSPTSYITLSLPLAQKKTIFCMIQGCNKKFGTLSEQSPEAPIWSHDIDDKMANFRFSSMAATKMASEILSVAALKSGEHV